MPTIHLTTMVHAPIERVFDLSRSIDLHKKSMASTGEKVLSGTTSGLAELNDTITWQAKHLFKTRVMKIKISAMNRPSSFIDEMVNGDFKSLRHEHHFKQIENGTLLIDLFSFEPPHGKIGQLFSRIFLFGYMRRLLEERNRFIKEYAESDKWKFILQR